MAKNSLKQKERRAGLLFVMPAMVQFVFFFLLPLCLCIFASMTDWNVLVKNKNFIGLDNVVELLEIVSSGLRFATQYICCFLFHFIWFWDCCLHWHAQKR